MVFYKNNQWNISDATVTYKDGGKLTTKSVGLEEKKWWSNLEKAWPEINIIQFEEILATEEQIQRLKKVNAANIPDGYSSIVSNYVKSGKYPDEFTHRLKDIELKETSRKHGVDLSEREIEALQLALQISDLELQILELGGVM